MMYPVGVGLHALVTETLSTIVEKTPENLLD